MGKLRTAMSIIFQSCFSLVVIPLYTYLAQEGVASSLATIFLFCAVSLLSLLNYFVIPNALYRFRIVRLLVEPLSRYEGFWLHTILPEDTADKRACGIISFTFDKHDGTYLFSGENYSVDGELISSFEVRDIQYDNRINGFRYWGAVKQYENASFSCYGELSFSESGGRLVTSGNGMFINNSKCILRAKYTTERLYNEKNNPYKLSRNLQSVDGRAKFASSIYRSHQEDVYDS